LPPDTPQIVVALGVQVCDQTGSATVVNANPSAAASARTRTCLTDGTAPTLTPPGALANSETTCGTPSLRLKTMR
jgi:hypothetical protein